MVPEVITMRQRLGVGHRTVLGWLLMGALWPSVAVSQAPDSYKVGRDAMKEARWQEAVEPLRQAIAADGREKKRRLRSPYLPHFYLGKALYRLDRCREALDRFAESSDQGVVQSIEAEFASLESMRGKCQALVNQAGDSVAAIRSGIDRAAGLRTALERCRSDRLLTGAVEQALPDLGTETAAAAKLASDAGELLRRGDQRPDLEILQESLATADRAVQDTQNLVNRCEAYRSEIRREAGVLRDELTSLVSEASDRLRSATPAARQSAGWQERRQAVLAWISSTVPVQLTYLELRQRISDLNEDIDALDSSSDTPSRPPRVLRMAAASLFQGLYVDVLVALESPRLRSARSRAHASLLRAAALFAVHRLSDGEDPSLLEAARDSVLRCRASDSSLKPLERVYSPAFVRFFGAVDPDASTSEAEP